MNRILTLCAALALLLSTGASAADLTGKWTWISRFNNSEFTNVAELTQTADRLGGTFTGPDGQKSEIKDAKLTKENEISFTITREFNGQRVVVRHVGTLDGDTIRGKRTITINGEDREVEWEARREKRLSLSGTWKWTVEVVGVSYPSTLVLVQQGERLSGKLTVENLGDTPATVDIQEGKLAGDEVSFRASRTVDGEELKAHFSGKVEGDTIKGQVTIITADSERKVEWKAARQKPASAAGKWEWIVSFGGMEFTASGEFKTEGDKITGSTNVLEQKAELREGRVSGNMVSFVTVRDVNGTELKSRFEGKLEGDTITGKIKGSLNGQEYEIDWVARRAK